MPRILHLGLGNFHRAHQAWYTLHAGGDWKITGVVMRNEALFDTLQEHGGYTLGIRGANGLTTEWVDTHDRVLLASRDADAVIAAFVDPEVQVATLTITEKGYCLSPKTGKLDLTHPTIATDLSGAPSSAIALLAHGLSRRVAANLGPLTVVSCDNISGNGHKLAAAVTDFAKAASLNIDPNTCFPDTMVDRITPATTDEIAVEFAAVSDRPVIAPVLTEAFSEWVIEDTFAAAHPAWGKAGATIVPDPAPFEMRKLRLLNAAHSYLAYAGQLAGHEFVHEAFLDPALLKNVRCLWREATATLPASVLPTTDAYCAALAERFSVPEIRHSLAQIAADGSLKLRERLVPMVKIDGSTPCVTAGIAAWIAFAIKSVRAGEVLVDANADDIAKTVNANDATREICLALLATVGLDNPNEAWLELLSAQVDNFLS